MPGMLVEEGIADTVPADDDRHLGVVEAAIIVAGLPRDYRRPDVDASDLSASSLDLQLRRLQLDRLHVEGRCEGVSLRLRERV